MFGNGSAMYCNKLCCTGTIGGFAMVKNLDESKPNFKTPAMLTCKHNAKHIFDTDSDFIFINDGRFSTDELAPKAVGRCTVKSEHYDFMLVFLDKELNQDSASLIDAKFRSPGGIELPTILHGGKTKPCGLVQKLGSASNITKGKVIGMASLPDNGIPNAYKIVPVDDYPHFSINGDSGSLVTCLIEEDTKEVVVYGMVCAVRETADQKITYALQLFDAIEDMQNEKLLDITFFEKDSEMQWFP